MVCIFSFSIDSMEECRLVNVRIRVIFSILVGYSYFLIFIRVFIIGDLIF